MGAQNYCADSEDGDHIDDPSEDALFMLIDDLNDTDNTFVVIQPDEDDPAWFASVAVQDEGGFEIVRRDTARREHEVTTDTDISRIARDLTIWMAARDFPGRPNKQVAGLKHGLVARAPAEVGRRRSRSGCRGEVIRVRQSECD